MEELKRKIVALIGMMDGKRDLDFICLAFQEVPRGDVAVAVLELCLDGQLVINADGISLPKEAEVPVEIESVSSEVEVAAGIEEESVEPSEVALQQEEPTEGGGGLSETAPTPSDPEKFEPETVPGVMYPSSVIRASDPVDALNLSTRPSNCVARLGISTVAQLVRALPGLAAQQGVGFGSVTEIRRSLATRAASFSSPLGGRTADELRYVSGCTEYVFDALGVLVGLPAQSVSGGREPSEQAHSIEELGLGDAINRRLRLNAISSVEDLLRMSPATLAAVPRLGYGTVARVRAAVVAFCSRTGLDAGAWGDGLVCNANVAKLLETGGPELAAVVEGIEASCVQRAYPVYEKSLRVLAAEFAWWRLACGVGPDEAVDEFLQMEASSDALASICRSALEDRCRRALGEDCSSFVSVPAVEPWQSVAAGMASVDGVRTKYDAESGTIGFVLDDVSEWLDGLEDERDDRLVRQRLEGKTLQEIGESEGVTRERVRQVVDVVLEEARPLKEDLWRGLFEAYDLTFAQFSAITGMGRPSYGYLALTAMTKKGDRRPLIQALDDAEVSDEVKDVIRNGNILTDCVFDGGELVRANKPDIIRHLLLQREGGQAFTLEELYDGYRAFLASHGLEESGRLDPTGMRAFGALLDRIPFAMYAKNPANEAGERRGIRYYDSETKDFSPLVEAVAKLAKDADIEISAEALMDEPSLADVLASLDIRNGYELHQVLYAWCGDIPGVRLGRVPVVTLGTGDRRRQILELISEIGPVDANSLAEEYGRRYGVRPMTFKANYLDGLDQYCHDGLYSYEVADLDEGQLATLRSILIPVEGWCPAAMVREKFLSCYPSWAGELITAENMKKVGFAISDGLLVKNGFDLRAAFAGMILGTPSFCLGEGEFTEEVCSNSVFMSELNKAVRHFEVLEVGKGEYRSIKAFSGGMAPMAPEGFSAFVDGVVARMVPGKPYSVKSLRALGLMGELDAVAAAQGLGDFFEESVLSLGYVGGALKRTSVAFTSLFARTAGVFSVSDAIEWYVRRRGSLSVQQLVDILDSEHGAVANPANMRFAIQRSSLAFDAERDMAVLPEGTPLLDGGPELLPVEGAEGNVDVEEAPASEEGTGPEPMPVLEIESKTVLGALSAPEEPTSPEQVGLSEAAEAPAEEPEPTTPVTCVPFRGSLVAEGGLLISADVGDAMLGGRPLELTPTELALLATMAAAPGKLFTRDELCDALFGDHRYVDGRTVDSHVKNLRAKLGDDPRDPMWISTVHGSGYRFDAEVDVSGAEGLDSSAASSAEYTSADGASRLLIDEAACRVCVNGEEVALTRSEYQLLVRLAQAAPEVLTRLDLCDVAGIQATSDADARSVDSHLKNLRKALGDDARNPTWVGTAHGRGYFFMGVGVSDAGEADEDASEPEAILEAEVVPEPAPEPEPATPDLVVQDELKSEIAHLEAELAQKAASLEQKERLREEYRLLSRQIPELEADVRSYGFFQRSERRAAQSRLDEAKARLESLKGEGSGMGLIRREVEELQDRLTELKARLVNQ